MTWARLLPGAQNNVFTCTCAEQTQISSQMRKYKKTSQRLRSLVKQLERGEASVVDLKKNLEYAASVLESVYIDETRRLLDTEDELSDIQSDAVPSEVRDWLASTFTRQMGMMLRRSEEKPRFKSIVHAVQAGIFVERMYRRTSNMVGLSYPPAVIEALKDVDKWSFDVFSLNEASGDHALKFIFYELLTRYDLISRFKNWLTELEIFAIIFSAAIHDYEHTGTTNNFHIQTRSDPAILYNDRSVLENHHLSAAYRLLQEDEEMNILINLSKDDWRFLIKHVAVSFHGQHLASQMVLKGNPRGFIDFIVEPTFTVLTDMTEKIVSPFIDEPSQSGGTGQRRSSLNNISSTDVKRSGVKSSGSEGSAPINNSVIPVDYKSFKATWTEVVHINRERWRAKVPKGILEEKAKKEAEEKARLAAEEKQKEMEAKSQAEESASGKAEKKTSGEAKNQVNGTRTNKSNNPHGTNSKTEKSSGEKQQNGTKKRSQGSPAPSTSSTSHLTLPALKRRSTCRGGGSGGSSRNPLLSDWKLLALFTTAPAERSKETSASDYKQPTTRAITVVSYWELTQPLVQALGPNTGQAENKCCNYYNLYPFLSPKGFSFTLSLEASELWNNTPRPQHKADEHLSYKRKQNKPNPLGLSTDKVSSVLLSVAHMAASPLCRAWRRARNQGLNFWEDFTVFTGLESVQMSQIQEPGPSPHSHNYMRSKAQVIPTNPGSQHSPQTGLLLFPKGRGVI
ncbi:hypothetical protein Celaphus_00012067 [Cervus elaphus hippelaphus]|uniref:Phosphodiesterase n=1 Tax=Cervus elaphus hippelaphus TaxID=46360 RepID=A0A212CL60_CEREH|nr:hypothetical protein Celaphus_00012067 [Cervus elaphus hippelaphus]